MLFTYLPADQTFRNLSHETLQNYKRKLKMVFLCTVLGVGRKARGQGQWCMCEPCFPFPHPPFPINIDSCAI